MRGGFRPDWQSWSTLLRFDDFLVPILRRGSGASVVSPLEPRASNPVSWSGAPVAVVGWFRAAVTLPYTSRPGMALPIDALQALDLEMGIALCR